MNIIISTYYSEPPTKLKRADSENTVLKKAIAEIKSSDKNKKKTYKVDDLMMNRYSDVSFWFFFQVHSNI